MSSSNRSVIAVALIVIIGIAGLGIYIIVYNPFAPPTTTTTTTTTTTPTGNPNPYDVAIVFATGGLGDKSFNDAAYKGAMDAKDQLGIDFTYVEPTTPTEFEGYIRDYTRHVGYDDPYDLIICVGFLQETALGTVANETESANQDYAIIDMWMNPSVYPTITSILFNENEGSALVGAIAGLMTTTNKVAIAAAYQNDMFDRFAGGYVFGANYTNPGIAGDSTHAAPYNCTVAYVGSDYRAFADIPAATVLAEGLYNVDDVDIIFAATGRAGLGVINTAKVLNETLDHPAWAIGVDSPQMYLGTANPSAPDSPTSVLTSMLKRVDVAVFDAIKNATTGSHVPGVWYGTVENGGLDYEIATELRVLPQSVLDEVDDFKTAIANGTITVPSTLYWT